MPTSGTVYLGGRDVSNVPPYRATSTPSSSPTPCSRTSTCSTNVAFGLRRRRAAKDEIARRVRDVLALVELPGFEQRKPAQLSGGQQQRVALARALVNEPRVLLLDEPLGALDLKLRKQMQLELKRIQRDVGITFLYVTHDQEEAMAMSDRLAVMNQGRIEQLGSPEDVYERPATDFVAGFLGTSNLLDGTVVSRTTRADATVALAGGGVVRVPADRLPAGRDAVRIGVRPEKLLLEPAGDAQHDDYNNLTGTVVLASYLGVSHQYTVAGPGGASITVYVQNLGASRTPTLGDAVRLLWLPEHTFVV